MDRHTGWHLLGWGESGPQITPEPCSICGAEPNGFHAVWVLGREETAVIIERLRQGRPVGEPSMIFRRSPVVIADGTKGMVRGE